MSQRSKRIGRIVIIAFGLILLLSWIVSLTRRPVSIPFGDKIGIVEVIGVLTDSKEIVEQLKEFRENSSIQAVLLRIDSPGGDVAVSQEIYEEVVRLREEKPVVVSMGSVAASGGYYIAVPATKIVANPGTVTGSIGALVEFVNVEELAQKWGVRLEVIKSGNQKDVGNPFRTLTPGERRMLQEVVDGIEKQFIEAVAMHRPLSVEEVEKIADGRIFTGKAAKEIGLVDRLGGLETAIKVLTEIAGLEGEPRRVYAVKKKRFSPWDLLSPDSWFEHLSDAFYGLLGIKVQYRYYPTTL